MSDDLPPPPPADLAGRTIRPHILVRGTIVHRVHETAWGAIFFGLRARWRFDDPTTSYGTMYVGLTPEVSFAETLLRGTNLVAESELRIRSFSKIEVLTDVRLAPLHGPAMVSLGASAAVSAGPYANAQAWSQAIHAHPSHVDGIIYRSTRDNSELVAVLFDRASAKITAQPAEGIMDDPVVLAWILDRYDAGLI